jgi:hypothetical protein
MASFCYNKAIADILTGAIDMDSNTLKVMLVNSTYTPNRDDDVVDAGGASDALDAEITATNYTKGWGGSGRKTATVTVAEQDASDRAVVIIADITWTALGGATNDTVVAAILIKEGGSNDTTSRLIAYFDITDTPTNGSDLTLDFDGTNGNIQFTT